MLAIPDCRADEADLGAPPIGSLAGKDIVQVACFKLRLKSEDVASGG